MVHRWAIRNCGLMLFRACTQRLCRPHSKSAPQVQKLEIIQSSAFIPMSQGPDALNVAIKLLSGQVDASQLQGYTEPTVSFIATNTDMQGSSNHLSVDPEHVFAGLDLLGRIDHSVSSWEQSLPYILQQLGNPICLIRDQAARIYAFNIDPCDTLAGISKVLQGFNICKENSRHGRLLATQYLLRRLWTVSTSVLPNGTAISQSLHEVRSTMASRKLCPLVHSKALEIFNDVMMKYPTEFEGLVDPNLSNTEMANVTEVQTRQGCPDDLKVTEWSFRSGLCSDLGHRLLSRGDSTNQNTLTIL